MFLSYTWVAKQQEDKLYTQHCPLGTAQPHAPHQLHHWLGADESAFCTCESSTVIHATTIRIHSHWWITVQMQCMRVKSMRKIVQQIRHNIRVSVMIANYLKEASEPWSIQSHFDVFELSFVASYTHMKNKYCDVIAADCSLECCQWCSIIVKLILITTVNISFLTSAYWSYIFGQPLLDQMEERVLAATANSPEMVQPQTRSQGRGCCADGWPKSPSWPMEIWNNNQGLPKQGQKYPKGSSRCGRSTPRQTGSPHTAHHSPW